MGKKDNATKVFLSDNERFSDICNYLMFDGRPIILGENLSELDAMELLTSRDRNYTQRQRDLLRRAVIRQTQEAVIAIIGIESQTLTDYGMPVRNMLYDAIRYTGQIEVFSKQNKGKLKSGKEFLSGLTKEDRLKPVITITVYWGLEPWDGPHTLYELLEVPDEDMLPYINNYRINLVSPAEIKDFSKFQTDVREVFEIVSVGGDKKALQELVRNRREYAHLGSDATEVIANLLNIEIQIKEDEDNNMCKAIEDMVNDGIRLGEKRGEKRGEKLGAKKQAEICAKNLLGLGAITVEQIATVTGLSLSKVKKLRENL